MTFVLAVTGLLLVASVTYAAYRRSDFGLAMLLAAELFHVAFGPNAAMLGGLHITPSDAAAIVLLAAGVIRRVRAYRTLDLNGAIIGGCLALFALSIVRGVLTFGLTVAGNESRAYVAPLAALLYFSTVSVEERDVRRYALSYIGFGVALCGIALGSAAGLPIGIMAWEVQDIAFINGRYLPATGAAALAVCGFLSLAVLQYCLQDSPHCCRWTFACFAALSPLRLSQWWWWRSLPDMKGERKGRAGKSSSRMRYRMGRPLRGG